MRRIQKAFLIAPLAPSLYLFILLQLSPSAMGIHATLMLTLSLIVSYRSCFIAGFPLDSVLKRKEKLSLLSLLIGGVGSGAFIFCLFGIGISLILESPFDYYSIAKQLLWGAVFGGVVSILFGLIAGLHWLTQRS